MKHLHTRSVGRICALVVLLGLAGVATAENVDPDGRDLQYAWAENVGWVNAEPNGDGGQGIQVGDSELSGWMWGENVGWVSLSCKNTLTCATTSYGIVNDGNGVLSGYAWAENVGWMSFACENTASCGTADYGVEIDPATGEFSGYAWSENVGWISFNCSNTASCRTADYKVKAGWVCSPPPAAPPGEPGLKVGLSGSDALLLWSLIPGATGSDIVYGGLNCLRSSGGDFGACTLGCLDDNRTTTSVLFTGSGAPGDGFWFLVRGQNCGGSGTYDTPQPPQLGLRDPEIAGSGDDCP